jgi:hypothetical protein
MKALRMSVLALLMAIASGRCLAERVIEPVTKQRAKELGIDVRATAAQNDAVKVVVEIEVKGELKSFRRVDLEMKEGDKVIFASALRDQRSGPDRVAVSFTVNRANMDQVTLRIVTLEPALGGAGYELRIKDFVDPTKLR